MLESKAVAGTVLGTSVHSDCGRGGFTLATGSEPQSLEKIQTRVVNLLLQLKKITYVVDLYLLQLKCMCKDRHIQQQCVYR